MGSEDGKREKKTKQNFHAFIFLGGEDADAALYAELCVNECTTRALVAHYTPLISVSLKRRAIFAQQLAHSFDTHKHGDTKGQRQTHTHTREGEWGGGGSKLFPV